MESTIIKIVGLFQASIVIMGIVNQNIIKEKGDGHDQSHGRDFLNYNSNFLSSSIGLPRGRTSNPAMVLSTMAAEA